MKTYLDCIPCFFKQGLNAARIAGADKATQKKILDDIAREIPDFPLDKTPPEMGKIIYQIAKKQVQDDDPFLAIKRESNALASKIAEDMREEVTQSDDKLFTAAKLAIIGNIIDHGAASDFPIEELESEIKEFLHRDMAVSHYAEFIAALEDAEKILYLGDNAGEIVFDKMFIEMIKSIYPDKHFVFAVRGEPVINDITMEDAQFCEMENVAEVISNGSDFPGTILSECSDEFRKYFDDADMIIAKGQGNFESLNEIDAPIFFLFRLKCKVVVKDVLQMGGEVKLGDMALMKNR